MAIIETKEITKDKGNETITETVKSIVFSKDGAIYEMDGVINILNGAWTLHDIVNNMLYRLEKEKDGVKAISDLEPNTELFIENITECNTYWLLSEELYDLDEPTIIVTEEIIKQAKYTVQQYENILNAFKIFKNINKSLLMVDLDIKQ